MATVTKPIALDESLNTTEVTPRNIADVLAEGIGDLIHAVSQIAPQTVYDLDDLGDVDITSPSNGQVLKYNGTSQKWENGTGGGSGDTVSWSQIVQTGTKIAEVTINGSTTDVYAPTGGGFSALLIITAGTGLTVTASKGGDTYTATETSTGTYEVSVDSAGTWTVSDGSNTATVAVSSSTTYYVTLSSVPDGSTVTPTDDVQILLACAGITDKSYTTLTELFADTATLASVIADNNAIDYLKRSTTFAKSEALVPAMTSNTTPSGICSGSNNNTNAYKAFNGDSTTYWDTDNNTQDVTITYEFPNAVDVSKVAFFVPSSYGSGWTVYATTIKYQVSSDGVSYTDVDTFSNITAGTRFVSTVSNVSAKYHKFTIVGYNLKYNSSPYQTRCFISEIQLYTADGLCDNSTAMSYIGLNNYASNTLLADSTWCSAICNSTYFESVLNVKVPTMTSDTMPSGECFGSPSAGYPYWKAFDGNLNSGWENYQPGDTTNKYVGYDFGKLITVYKTVLYPHRPTAVDADANPKNCKIQRYDNGSWSDITNQFVFNYNEYSKTVISDYISSDNKFRLLCLDNWGNSNYVHIGELQFYGRADV